jgi:transcriptional regulator with XRE-family HTH domain
MTDEQRQIGARIAAARREAGLTQKELAQRLGVTTRSVQNYESGVVIPHKHLRQIEMLARKRLGWILTGDRPDILAGENLERLEHAIESHAKLLQQHLETLREQTEHLRELREASTRRRGAD